MTDARILQGDTEPIIAPLFSPSGAKISGATVTIHIQRLSDNFFFDWSDDTFKVFGSVVTPEQALTEFPNSAGEYRLDIAGHSEGFDTSTIVSVTADDTYVVSFTVTSPANSSRPLPFNIKVDQWVGDIFDTAAGVAIADDEITAAKIATDAIGSDELAASAIAEIADGVWDEDIEAAHGTDATAGLLLRVLGAAISNRSNNATLDAVLGVADSAGSDLEGNVRGTDDRDLSELAGAGWSAATDTLELIRDAITAAGTPASIADAVWDELRAGHVGAGSFGEGVLVQSVNTGGIVAASFAASAITAAVIATDAIDADALATDAVDEIADGVWDEDIEAAHGTDATAGLLLRALGADISNRANNATLNAMLGVADAIGSDLEGNVRGADDRDLSELAGSGWLAGTDTLEQIRDAITTAGTPATIADAVWDELRAGHVGAGSFGEGVLVQTVNAGGILATSFAAGAIDATAIATDAIDSDALAADAITSVELATSAVQEIVDGLLDEVNTAANHSTVDSVGLMLREMWQVHGLDDGNALEVDSTTPAGTRQVPADGSVINQTVATSGSVTTVTRVP